MNAKFRLVNILCLYIVFFSWTVPTAAAGFAARSNCETRLDYDFSKTRQFVRTSQNPKDGEFEVCPMDGFQTMYLYNDYFSTALEGKTIEAMARERKGLGKSAHVADICGSAVFSPAPETFDSLTGVRLRRLEREYIPQRYIQLNWDEVAGNLYRQRTWRLLDQNMSQRGMQKFDFIFIRPAGFIDHGYHSLGRTAYMQNSLIILNRVWRRLSADDGRMFVQWPQWALNSPEYGVWQQKIKASGGKVDVFPRSELHRDPIVRFTKDSMSPASLTNP